MPAPVPGVGGNWQCPHCDNVNFAIRDTCNRCKAPRPSAAHASQYWPASGGKAAAGKPAAPRKGAGPVAGVDGNWACPNCANVKFATRDLCNLCHLPKAIQHGPPAIRQVGLSQYSPVSFPAARRGAPVAGVDGNWLCQGCGNVNFAAREVCNRCSAPKPIEAEALVQMPQEKWSCPLCSNVNAMDQAACNACELPNPHLEEEVVAEAEYQVLGHPPARAGGSRRGAPLPGVDGNWMCAGCGNVNYAVRQACNLCQMPRDSGAVEKASFVAAACPPAGKGGKAGRAPVAGVDGNWQCTGCGNVNFAVRDVCNRCKAPRSLKRQGPVAGVDGNWACPSCQNVNYSVRDACNRCNLPRHEDTEPMPTAKRPRLW